MTASLYGAIETGQIIPFSSWLTSTIFNKIFNFQKKKKKKRKKVKKKKLLQQEYDLHLAQNIP